MRGENFELVKTPARAMEDQISATGGALTAKSDQGPALSPVLAVVDRDKCIACGACQGICPTGAISVREIARVDPMRCMGCGQCVAQCPQEAIALQTPAMGSL